MDQDIYKTAGVNLSAAQSLKKRIGFLTNSTLSPSVLKGAGAFSGLYELSGFREPVIVSSTRLLANRCLPLIGPTTN